MQANQPPAPTQPDVWSLTLLELLKQPNPKFDAETVLSPLNNWYCYCVEIKPPRQSKLPLCFTKSFSSMDQTPVLESLPEMIIRAHICAYGFGCDELLLY